MQETRGQPSVHNWTTRVEYYDVETGEQISKALAKSQFIILKKIKHVKIEGTKGTITYWCQCEKNRQRTIF